MYNSNLKFLAVVLAVLAGNAVAQSSGLSRTVVGRGDVSIPGREAVTVRVELAPGGYAGRHSHPGDEIGYVTEGQLELLLDGQPPRLLKTGESFVIPAGVVHDAHNPSTTAGKVLSVYVVEKGKPLATPAPAAAPASSE